MKGKLQLLGLCIILVFVAGTFIVHKIRYLASDPTHDKDCVPLIPADSLKENTNTRIIEKPIISLPWLQKGGSINDASCIDKTYVFGIVEITKEEDIKNALLFAKENKLKVSTAGVRHSMGGQAFAKNALILDMRKFNKIKLNADKTITVQSGATWHDIQNIIHPKFAIKAMQSTDIFTVGGSISVNAHGMDHRSGSVAKTIKSMRVMLPDGTIHTVSPAENTELFRHVTGGYGLFGIILDSVLEVTNNDIYTHEQSVIKYQNFPKLFNENLISDETIGLFYGHLSTAPSSFLEEMIVYTYKKTDSSTGTILPLTEVQNVPLRRFVINLAKEGTWGAQIKWLAEKYIEPKIQSCMVSRNQAMKEGESCLVSRNHPMHDSVKYLKNDHSDETDILHEYYIPREAFIPYVDDMRSILKANNTNLLNASVRVIHKEDTALNYAPEDMFAIVLYINQKTDRKGNTQMEILTKELIDLTIKYKGRFFLPYQLHYTKKQLTNSYPEIEDFFAVKKAYDPNELLTNTWYEKYGKETTQ